MTGGIFVNQCDECLKNPWLFNMSSPGFFQKLLKVLNPAGDNQPKVSPKKPVSTPPLTQTTATDTGQTTAGTVQTVATKSIDTTLLARQCLKLAGGHANVARIDACVTRVRLTLKDSAGISDDRFKAVGALAVVRVGDNYLQIVIGPEAREVAIKMQGIPVTDDLANVEVPA